MPSMQVADPMRADPVASACQEGVCLILELGPGRLASSHLDESAADGPDVSLAAVASLLDDLGRHPVGSSFHRLVPRVCATGRHANVASARWLSIHCKKTISQNVDALTILRGQVLEVRGRAHQG